MSVAGTIRATAFLLAFFLVVVIGGVFLNALLVRIEPMLLYGLPASMLSGYFSIRGWLSFMWQWSVRIMIVLVEFLIVTAGIGWLGNIFKAGEGYA